MVSQGTQGHSFRLAALNIPNGPFSLCRCGAASSWGIFKGRVMWGLPSQALQEYSLLVSKVSAKTNACFIDHLLCASPACQEEVREQRGEGRREKVRGEREETMEARGGRRKDRIEIERGGEREIKVCLREGT